MGPVVGTPGRDPFPVLTGARSLVLVTLSDNGPDGLAPFAEWLYRVVAHSTDAPGTVVL
jgi:hypothetical protein